MRKRLYYKIALIILLSTTALFAYFSNYQTDTIDKLKQQMVTIPAGTFEMGSRVFGEDESPVHIVNIESFLLSSYEINFDQYDFFANATGRSLPDDQDWGRGTRPVINVSWHDSKAFIEWLNKETGERYRLPSEAEMEYAARAGSQGGQMDATGGGMLAGPYWDMFPWEADFSCHRGQFGYHERVCERAEGTAPVGSFEPNSYGLFDIYANVSEWVEDCGTDNYANGPYDNKPIVHQDCKRRGLRGSNYVYGEEQLYFSARYSLPPSHKEKTSGFRIAMDIFSKEEKQKYEKEQEQKRIITEENEWLGL